MNNQFVFKHLLILFSIFCLCLTQNTNNFDDFGPNKPHLLFQVGERKSVSLSYGYSYWRDYSTPLYHQAPKSDSKKLKKYTSHFSQLRLKYKNTNDGLYVDTLVHDGSKHIEQIIQDYKLSINSNIKYSLNQQGWKQKVELNKSQNKQNRFQTYIYNSFSKNESDKLYFMQYMVVQNSDPGLIDTVSSTSSPFFLRLNEISDNKAQVQIKYNQNKGQLIYINSTCPLKVFGLSLNISQSYDVKNILQMVQHVIQRQKYPNTLRNGNDTQLHKWVDNQVQLIKKNNWQNANYLLLTFYSQFQDNCTYQIGNKTQKFNDQKFNTKSQQIKAKFFSHLHLEPSVSNKSNQQWLRHMIFNLFSGQAFYYGILYTQNSLLKHELDYTFSLTPSRLIFPRGFLWDQGFHLSVVTNYQPSLTLQILQSWMNKIDLLGWIGRQQIRGMQMGSMMPELKFIYQDIFEMNPPTLLLGFLSMIQKSQSNSLSEEQNTRLISLLKKNFWKLQKWYRYLSKTQSHQNLIQIESLNKTDRFRWRCKDQCDRGNFMGSGLDDYPRIDATGQISSQHIDLISWLYFFTESLKKFAIFLNMQKQTQFYEKKQQFFKQKIMQGLDQNYIFKDQAIKAKNNYNQHHVDKIGYVSLAPFFVGSLLGNSDKQIKALKKYILLSQDGLRSLDKSDIQYGTLDNYWRGPVWLPINYLVLRACKKYYWQNEQIKNLYNILRKRLLQTGKRNWQQKGYLFENYHLGKGNRGYPFYGWTTLLANILSQQY